MENAISHPPGLGLDGVRGLVGGRGVRQAVTANSSGDRLEDRDDVAEIY